MEKSLRELLEYRNNGHSLDPDYIRQLAHNDIYFARAWLIHSVGSGSSLEEIGFAVDAALQHQLPDIEYLLNFCRYSLTTPADATVFNSTNTKQLILDVLGLWTHVIADQHQFVSMFNSSLQSSAYQRLLPEVSSVMSLARVHSQKQSNDLVTQVRNNSQFPVGSPASHIEWAALERFICAVTGQDLNYAEPLMIYRYGPAEEYRWHCDYISDRLPQNQTELQHFGNRSRTAIICLQDTYIGGETAFKVWQQAFKSKLGQILMFDNLTADGKPDPDSVHCGKPVIAGEKWIATLWFRQKPLWFRTSLI